MLCESCGKNQASIHYTKIINGEIKEHHLCADCTSSFSDLDFDTSLFFNKFFTGLIDNIDDLEEKVIDIKCPECGLTYKKFKAIGKFGCSKCYKTFENQLDSLVRGLHGHNTHRGKIPKRSNVKIFLKRETEKLRVDLENAIKREEFEKAAIIRDELKTLNTKLEEQGE